ncbi:hypothetical protein [Dinoroseobacter sp. S76]|uniref:hypothetical protein n=1 Tax=Dinoroseobacter sp. S76 TaxID=3415124 RepID=UPI003C7A7F61
MKDLHLTKPPRTWSLSHILATRMSGPGGLYNIGNAIGFASGLGFAVLGALGLGGTDALVMAILTHLAGSGGALAMSLAMVLFFISGEFYHRAYATSDAKVAAGTLKWADGLSGVAALFLAISLTFFGEIWMAITSTVLLAGGKFGNTFLPPHRSQMRIEHHTASGEVRVRDVDVFRVAVILSRVPAMLGLAMGLVSQWPGLTLLGDGPTVILLGCYCLWLRADLLLAKT